MMRQNSFEPDKLYNIVVEYSVYIFLDLLYLTFSISLVSQSCSCYYWELFTCYSRVIHGLWG